MTEVCREGEEGCGADVLQGEQNEWGCRGWREMREQSAGTLKVKRGEGNDGEWVKWRISEWEACSAVCLRAFQSTAVKRGFERCYQFLSWALQKRPAAQGEGVTRSLARDGWRREAGSASTRYIIIHLLLSLKPPASEPPTHQETFLLQPKAAWLIYTDIQTGQRESIQKLL